MDWTKQSEEMFKTWTEAQKKMWDHWLESMQPSTSSAQTAQQVWQKTLETWEELATSGLTAHKQWLETWANNFNGQKDNPEAWAKEAQEMMKQWSEGQQTLWKNWFGLMKQVDLSKMAGGWEDEAQKSLKNWQDAAHQAMESHMQWVNKWASEATKTKK